MITITKPLYETGLKNKYALIEHMIPETIKITLPDALLFDIETTGLSASRGMCYLIGVVYLQEQQWFYRQWFATKPNEEAQVIEAFFAFAKKFSYLIHFNGEGFDIPFLSKRCTYMNLPFSFDEFTSIDLFKRTRALSSFLQLDNYKQKTIEQFLHIDREDLYSGGDLIQVYKKYVMNPTEEACQLLLLHNHDDIAGLLELLPILSYEQLRTDFTEGTRKNIHWDVNEATNYEGKPMKELLLTVTLPCAFPQRRTISKESFYMTVFDHTIKIRVEILHKELKYFYPDYKNYYYLPEEDYAIYKSVATYVDKNHRVQAKAENCYTRKLDNFIPQPTDIITPAFRENFKDSISYFQCNDAFLQNEESIKTYTKNVVAYLCNK